MAGRALRVSRMNQLVVMDCLKAFGDRYGEKQTSLFLPVKVLQSLEVIHRDARCAGLLSDLNLFSEISGSSVRDIDV
jgi:hypothetical protein